MCTAAVMLAAHTVNPLLLVIFTSWACSGHFLHNRKVGRVMKQTNIALGLYYLHTVHAHADLRAMCEIPSTVTAFQPIHKHKCIGDYSWHMTPTVQTLVTVVMGYRRRVLQISALTLHSLPRVASCPLLILFRFFLFWSSAYAAGQVGTSCGMHW